MKTKPETIICVPTYNEARNIKRVTEAILYALPYASIFIIDDNSPDGTGAIADRMAEENPQISVLNRSQKEGLGRAYLDGFRTLLNRTDAELIVQMDADTSHPPDRLPDMICAAKAADLVIGSRYVPGGRTRNWNLTRRAISRFGSLYARVCMEVPVRDMTGGFKVWRRDMLKQVMAHPITSDGYAFQVETTFLANRLGGRIAEVPILFTDRNVGKSKMSMAIAFEASWRLPLIRWSSHFRSFSSHCPSFNLKNCNSNSL